MNQYEVLSINVGKPQEYTYHNKIVSTAIWKTPIEQSQQQSQLQQQSQAHSHSHSHSLPLMLSSTQLEGDGQADLVNHGGPDKAVMVYSYDHYGHWEQLMAQQLTYGSFGENITVSGLTEHDVCIGDTFQWGEATIQISQPRYPCYKLDIRHERSDMVQLVLDTGFTGYYVRVLQPGKVSKGAGLIRIHQHPLAISVAKVSEAFVNKNTSSEIIHSILAVEELSEGWRRNFEMQLG